MKVQVTNFGLRHFKSDFKGTKIKSIEPDRFSEIISNCFNAINNEKTISIKGASPIVGDEIKLLDGYADFCKLLVVPNFTDTKTGSMPITMENFHHLRSGYSARSEGELPVLSRWFEVPKNLVPEAQFLVVVLYDREQLQEIEPQVQGF